MADVASSHGVNMRMSLQVCAGILLTACIEYAQAQAFPTKPLRLVVPYSTGGTTDVVARAIGPKLSELLGQQVIVENRAGAAGNIGTEHVAKSAPDGYTSMLVGFEFAANAGLYAKLPYDALRDFAPVALIATYPFMLVAHPALPVQSVRDLIAYAKANPGQINYASAGNGSSLHLTGELFKALAGVNLTHVPYKGGGPAITDLLAGHAQLLFISNAPVASFIKSGRLKLLAVTAAARIPSLPDVATVQEGGVPGFEVLAWLGIVVPAGTPRPIVNQLNVELGRTMQAADVRERLASMGAELGASSPEVLHTLLRDEIAKWTGVVKSAGIRLD